MKLKLKHIALAVVGIVGLASFTYSLPEGKDIPTDGEQMRILNYHGHRYICYRFYSYGVLYRGGYGYGGASITHDPDCPCHKRK